MIAGITGHQHPGDAAMTAWIRTALVEQIGRGSVRRGLSSLAIGVDQMFVEILRAREIAFEAVIPCEGYEATFGDDAARARYAGLVTAAAVVHHLPFPCPTGDAFFAAGEWIVARCDLLIAVWNGLPARGLGGTADVVALARARRRSWIHIDPVARTINAHAPGA